MPEGIVIARLARPWGLKGEVMADMLTDFPERFDAVGRVTLRRKGEERQADLQSFRFHKGRVLLKFVGFDSMTDAGALAGYDMVVPEDELYELPEGEDVYYDFQLVGCAVETVAGEPVGRIASVMRAGAGELLSVERDGGAGEALIPFVDEICVEVDVEAKRVVVDLPEGLLDI